MDTFSNTIQSDNTTSFTIPVSYNSSGRTENTYAFNEHKPNIPIVEQEQFMHMIYDVVHIGVSMLSLKISTETLAKKYTIKDILNSRLKNEKYSDSCDFPLAKVIYENKGIGNEEKAFYDKKLAVIQYFLSLGADMNTINETYMNYIPFSLDYLLKIGDINLEIYDFIKKCLEKK
jgi:hypothetical protein